MIIGIGTDIVQIDRIKQAVERQGYRFAERILCPSELSVFEQKNQSASYLAKRFAAKEAASKALGTGIGPISWQDMEISNNNAGAPVLSFRGAAKERMESLGAHQVSISLSDELDYAVAFVVLSTD
jgi:holo-[acyl-carrier protein] synthase